VTKTLDGFDVAASSVKRATFDYLTSLEWIDARENLCLVRPGRNHVTLRAPFVDDVHQVQTDQKALLGQGPVRRGPPSW